MDRLLTVTAWMSVALIALVLNSVRRAHVRVEYSVTWLLGAAVMLILSQCWPLLDGVRKLLGLPDTPLALFLIGSSGILIMFYRFSVIVSRLKDNNIALAQRVAILEFHLKALSTNEKQ